jgi:hypothetical protein
LAAAIDDLSGSAPRIATSSPSGVRNPSDDRRTSSAYSIRAAESRRLLFPLPLGATITWRTPSICCERANCNDDRYGQGFFSPLCSARFTQL